MHIIKLKTLLVTAFLIGMSAAAAQHNRDQDVYITVDDPVLEEVAETVALGSLGDELYDTQEGAHDTVTDTTGEEIEHYYINICLGKQCVPIDPIRFSN